MSVLLPLGGDNINIKPVNDGGLLTAKKQMNYIIYSLIFFVISILMAITYIEIKQYHQYRYIGLGMILLLFLSFYVSFKINKLALMRNYMIVVVEENNIIIYGRQPISKLHTIHLTSIERVVWPRNPFRKFVKVILFRNNKKEQYLLDKNIIKDQNELKLLLNKYIVLDSNEGDEMIDTYYITV
jgi:hypothetical protein